MPMRLSHRERKKESGRAKKKMTIEKTDRKNIRKKKKQKKTNGSCRRFRKIGSPRLLSKRSFPWREQATKITY